MISRRARLVFLVTLLILHTIVLGHAAEKRGGTLQFAVTVEPTNYDCHGATSFAFLHPIAPQEALMTDQSPDNREVLTNRQGHPVHDNQNQRTIGSRGPATLENYQFLEKMSHFDRERVPERVVHARGTTAFGYFEADGTVGDEPIASFTRAKLFQTKGKRTDLAVRFSTVAGGRDSSEVARDPRGDAIILPTGRRRPRRERHARRR